MILEGFTIYGCHSVMRLWFMTWKYNWINVLRMQLKSSRLDAKNRTNLSVSLLIHSALCLATIWTIRVLILPIIAPKFRFSLG